MVAISVAVLDTLIVYFRKIGGTKETLLLFLCDEILFDKSIWHMCKISVATAGQASEALQQATS
jgi:hypothetical protein